AAKEADIIILDATRMNVARLNQVPRAVVSLMDRTNVETVIVAGKVRKWRGNLLGVDLPALRRQLEASRDFVFNAAGVPQELFRSSCRGWLSAGLGRLRPPRSACELRPRVKAHLPVSIHRATRSGKPAASPSRVAATTPRSVMSPVTSRAGVT